MGIFAKPKSLNYSAALSSAKKEKEDTAKAKARLLETEGKNNGEELKSEEGKSVRRVFG
jgi:hypothetical protein